jgi:hypothetical protein
MSTIAATNSLFEIDAELDSLLDEIEEQTAQGGEPSGELVARFQQFCSAHGEKVDRIGRFPAPDGGARAVLPQRGCPAQRPGPRRGRQGGANEEHGSLLPDEPRPQSDRGTRVHPARPEEQPGLGADHR